MRQYVSANDPTIRQILTAAFPGSRIGKTVTIEACEEAHTMNRYWSEGTRYQYAWVTLTSHMNSAPVPHTDPPQFGGDLDSRSVPIPPGVALVEWGTVFGKTAYPRIFCHPSSMTGLLPRETEATTLTTDARVVLKASASYKSSYRREYAADHGVRESAYAKALDELKNLGLITPRNAVTPEGRTVAETIDSLYPRGGSR